MKILKFGGSSLKDGDSIKNAVKIINTRHPCGVVVSASSGITNKLIELINHRETDLEYKNLFDDLVNHHMNILDELGIKNSQTSFSDDFSKLTQKLKFCLESISKKRPSTLKLKDEILSYGELLSANIITRACITNTINVELLDARKLILTDDNYGNASVNYKVSNYKIRKSWNKKDTTKIIPGFIGATEKLETTTLGRNGSDHSASIIGAALNVKKIEIWSDVNGILAANPNIIPDAKTIPYLTYNEAIELANSGAKVLFPGTIVPLLNKSIPLHIKNVFEPNNCGTLIKKNREITDHSPVGISAIDNISLIKIQLADNFEKNGLTENIFRLLIKEKIKILFSSQIYGEYLTYFAINSFDIERAKSLLNQKFIKELENINTIEFQNNLSFISIIGENISNETALKSNLSNILESQNTRVIAMASGVSKRNISLIINKDDLQYTIESIYNYTILKHKKISVYIAGCGTVGSELIKLLNDHPIIRICGIMNSKNMLLNKNKITVSNFKNQLAKGVSYDLDKMISNATKSLNPVFVDVSSSSYIAERTSHILSKGISVVTANKIANTMSQDYYNQVRKYEINGLSKFKYETNVGAGLPIIETIQTLIKTGDKIDKIEGILSGTLSYLFNEFNEDISFSSLVKKAKSKGFTEPDPRHDLNGMDVGRKILILARETGAQLEIEDISIQNLIPKMIDPNLSINNFLIKLSEYDDDFLLQYNKAKKEDRVLRYIASWNGSHAKVSLRSVGRNSPFYYQNGRENFIIITTNRYKDSPLIIKGHGAGAEVTAAGVMGDILKCQK